MQTTSPATSQQAFRKIGAIVLCLLLIFFALFDWVVNENWSSASAVSESHTMQKVLPDMVDGLVVEQQLSFDGNVLHTLTLYPNLPQGASGMLHVALLQGDTVLAQTALPLESMVNMVPVTVDMQGVSIPAGSSLTYRMWAERWGDTRFFSLFYGDTINIGRYQVAAGQLEGLTAGGVPVVGRLDMDLAGRNNTNSMTIYRIAAGCVFLVALGLYLVFLYRHAKGHRSPFLILIEEITRYRFLLNRLVARDFNTKYRRSMLGVFWSFLNPLLTMAVQYVVFSTLFRSDVPNFVAYLMSGIVMFNFFSEASNLCLNAITGNASLINKVYMPKYIYPISRLCSAFINLGIALIPLMAVVLFSGLPITKAFLLIPLPILFMAAFSLGVGLILATANVFFRDTSFLWGIVILLWTYLTPLFYPETIIPANLLSLYHMNPMYQFVYFFRCILLQGVTPQPITYLYCTLCAVIPLGVGIWVFRKKQNDFVLHL